MRAMFRCLRWGHFDLEDYVDYLIEWLEFLEHMQVVAVRICSRYASRRCLAYAAAAVMSADKHPCRP